MTDPSPPRPAAALFGMFLRPEATLTALAGRPTTWLVLLALALTAGAFQATVVPKVDLEGEIRAALAESGQEIPDERIETLVERSEGLRWVQPVVSAVVVPGAVVMVALLLWLGGRLAGSQATYHPVLSGVAHAVWPPFLVKSAVGMVVLSRYRVLPVGRAEHLVRSSLAAFLPADTAPGLLTLAGYLDVFFLWGLALLVLALVRLGGLPVRRAALVTGILAGAWIAVRVAASAALSGAGA